MGRKNAATSTSKSKKSKNNNTTSSAITTDHYDDATNQSRSLNKSTNSSINDGLIWVDPNRIRFQHSKIRPVFSSCGRSIEETLNEIRSGTTLPTDLPPIQVLVASSNDWYFSLNNRRLYVLKRCREEGLLIPTDNKIPVRVREPKSSSEMERYSVENCVLEAKIVKEYPSSKPKQNKIQNKTNDNNCTDDDEVDDNYTISRKNRDDNNEDNGNKDNGNNCQVDAVIRRTKNNGTTGKLRSCNNNDAHNDDSKNVSECDDDDDDDTDDDDAKVVNRFSALFS